MQTILGAGGPVGNALARELKNYTSSIRLVSRHPEKVNANDELVKADLVNYEEVLEAVKGSEIVYLTAGLPYDHKVWKKKWPVIMDNVLHACEEYSVRLVFFDNVYMYDIGEIKNMTEGSKINPPSRKGKVRAAIASRLMQKVKEGEVKALIARSADFYGPESAGNSILMETVFKPLSKKKKANWMGKSDKPHSFTYIPDAAKATALLGNTDKAYGQVWHLPTAANPPSGKEWVEMIGSQLGAAPKFREVPKWMVKLMGWFMPVMRESVEMFYQYDRTYVFDSSKFEKEFALQPTPYSVGVKETVQKNFS